MAIIPNCWVILEQYMDDCGNIVDVNHVFFDLEKAKTRFEDFRDPYVCEIALLQVGAEDPNTGEVVGVGEPILRYNAEEEEEESVEPEPPVTRSDKIVDFRRAYA